MDSVHLAGGGDPSVAAAGGGRLRAFRSELFGCLGRRADELFELTDALLCTDGPVSTLVGLCLAPEHRRGHGALYDAVNVGRVDVERLRRVLAGLALPRMFGGRIVLALDATAWLRPDAETSPRAAVLPRLWARTGPGGRPADPGLAVSAGGRAGERADQLDGAAGRRPAGP